MLNSYYRKKLTEAQTRIDTLTRSAVNSEGAEFDRILKQVGNLQTDVKNYQEALGVKK